MSQAASARKKKPVTMDTEVRERIERTAIELIASREFSDAGPADIARLARCSLQTLYTYYGGKQGLLDTCIDGVITRLSKRMLDHLQGIKGYKDRLRKFFWVTLDYSEENSAFGQMVLSAVYTRSWRIDDPDTNLDRLSGFFMEVLREGQDNGMLSTRVHTSILLDYFYGVLFRLIWMHHARKREYSLTEQSDELFEMLWQSLRARGAVPGDDSE